MALSSGEVLLWKPLHRRESRASSSTYTPCCKEGAADGAAVTLIRWCPGGEGSFVTAHANGQLLLYDRRRAEDPSVGGAASSRRSMRGVSTSLRGGSGGQQQAQRQSPVSSWQVSAAGAAVSALAFSANGRSLAIGMADGVLSLFDFAAEAPLMRLHSYFGGVLCCAWSADGRYLLSGGESLQWRSSAWTVVVCHSCAACFRALQPGDYCFRRLALYTAFPHATPACFCSQAAC